jgi:hypothetical protein
MFVKKQLMDLFRCRPERFFRSLSLLTFVCFVACWNSEFSWSQDFAKGVVFLDANNNRKWDQDEKPIPGVRVSNGVKIVTTDEKGAYSLPVNNDSIIFVIKPSGYRTPLSKENLPQFYYIHKPDGSPKQKYPGVAPTGKLPESVDFPLYRQSEPSTFKAIMFGDPQPRNQKEVDYIAHDVVEELVGTDAALGVTLGDIMFDDLSLFGPNNRMIALMGIPWYNVIGNHDINYDARNRKEVNETFERNFGPSYYSFDYGSTHFIVLDNINWVLNNSTGKFGYRGGFGEEQLEFVKADLNLIPKDQFVCLMMHIPIVGVDDKSALYQLIEDRPLTISISGHTHHHEHVFLGKKEGFNGKQEHHHIINVTVSGSWWSGNKDERGIPHATMSDGAPNGYSVITFDGKKYQIDFKAAGLPESYQMRIAMEDSVKKSALSSTDFYVNVFNGSEKSKVLMMIDDRKGWTPLSKVLEKDPVFLKMVEEDRANKNRQTPGLPAPKICPHLWKGGLPALETGTHLLTIQSTDMHGKVHTSRKIFRVVQ